MNVPHPPPLHLRCISREEAINSSVIHPGCRDWLADSHVYLYLEDNGCLYDILESLHLAFISTRVSALCNETLRGYFCNYVYPGCDPAHPHKPVGICREDCMTHLLGESCDGEVDFLVNVAEASEEFEFPKQCNNTLAFLEHAGLSVEKDHQSCLGLSSKCTLLVALCMEFNKQGKSESHKGLGRPPYKGHSSGYLHHSQGWIQEFSRGGRGPVQVVYM